MYLLLVYLSLEWDFVIAVYMNPICIFTIPSPTLYQRWTVANLHSYRTGYSISWAALPEVHKCLIPVREDISWWAVPSAPVSIQGPGHMKSLVVKVSHTLISNTALEYTKHVLNCIHKCAITLIFLLKYCTCGEQQRVYAIFIQV